MSPLHRPRPSQPQANSGKDVPFSPALSRQPKAAATDLCPDIKGDGNFLVECLRDAMAGHGQHIIP